MTDRQKEVLDFIKEFIEERGFPPTYREIGSHFNISSTFGVKRHVDALIKKGYLNIDSYSSRSISLTEKSNDLFNIEKVSNTVEIPILGRVAAGYPVLSEQNIEGTLLVDNSLIRKGSKYFGLKVRGDSMIEDGIFEGDTVIVKSQNSADHNEIVIAMLDNESTVKRLYKKNNQVELLPANKNYKPISVNSRSNFSILGKVIAVLRIYN